MAISLSEPCGELMACSTVNSRNRRILSAFANALLARSLCNCARIWSGEYVSIVNEFYSISGLSVTHIFPEVCAGTASALRDSWVQ